MAVRNVRRDVHNDLREFEREKLISEDDLEARPRQELQKVTDEHSRARQRAAEKKEDEVLEV